MTHWAARCVEGQGFAVGTEAVAMSIRVRENARLQLFVRREADAPHDVLGRKNGLFDFGEIAARVAVEHHHADPDKRVVAVRPDLGRLEGVVGVFPRRPQTLSARRPLREPAALDRVK